jgi:UDP-2,3-diacylglucosamine pyrophosphatase LpxH
MSEVFEDLLASFFDKIDSEDMLLGVDGKTILVLHDAVCTRMSQFEKDEDTMHQLEEYRQYGLLRTIRINLEQIIRDYEPKLMDHINELLGIDDDEIE